MLSISHDAILKIRFAKNKLGTIEMSAKIESAIKLEQWEKARQLIRVDLKNEPNSHWLLTRLALTYYECRSYKRALHYSKKAVKLEPSCPLALWDLAGALAMLGRYGDSIKIFRSLTKRGIKSIAYGDCGEGLSFARGLIADCWYRIAVCQKNCLQPSKAVLAFKKHISLRGPGCRSIYPLKQVKAELRKCLANR